MPDGAHAMSSSPSHKSQSFNDASYARAALHFLSEVGAIFADWPNAETVSQRIVRLAIPSLCDRCIITFTDDVQRRPWIAVAHHIALLRSLNGHSNLIVPLTARERVIGGCWFAFGESGRNYTPADLTLVEDLVHRVAQTIDNARLYTATQVAERQTGEALALLDTLITTTPNGIAFLNRELRYVRINDALAAINGLPAADHIGHTPSELFPLFGAAFEQQCAQVITTGTPILNVEVIHKLPHDPQHIRHWLTSYYPVRGQDGQILGAGIVVVEITAQKQDEDKLLHYAQRLQAVHAIDQAILEAQPQDVLTKNVLAQLHTLAPYDRASVVMYADTKPTNVITYVVTEDSLRINYTTSSVSAAWAEFIPQLSGGRVVQINDLQTVAPPSALTQHLLRDGIRRLLSIPMIIDGQLIGSLHIGAATPGAYTEDQIAIAYDIADNLAVGIQQARLREAEQQARQIAETIRAANEALSRTLNLHTVLDTLLKYLERLVPYDSANVILIDNQKIIMKAGRGYDSWTNSHAIRPPYDDISGFPLFNAMLTTHQSTLVPDTSACAVWITTPETEQLCSWIGIPLIANDAVIGFYCLGKTRPHFFTQAHVQIAESLAAPAAVAIQNAQLYTDVVESQNRLQALSRRLAEVQEAERQRIAQELHDQFGQTLTGLQIIMETLPRFSVEERNMRLTEARFIVQDLIRRIRALSLDLRPAMLDDMGLLAALSWYFRRYTEQTGVDVTFRHRGLDVRFAPEVETTAYRVIQEALTNVARHAGVSEARVRVSVRAKKLSVQVSDSGRGFDLNTVRASSMSSGLTGMHERVALLGGTLTIETAPDAGAHISADIPSDLSTIDD
jgi:signal transduction histidine kinase/PAS domain-containing protein